MYKSAIIWRMFKNLWFKTELSNKWIVFCLLGWFFAINYYFKNPIKVQHIAFISATYFKTSSIYPNNTVVILFNSQYPWRFANHLVCKSSSILKDDNKEISHTSNDALLTHMETYANVRIAFMKIPLCDWATYIAVCKVTENAVTLSLTSKKMSLNTATVPIRNAITEEKFNVVTCFSPLFYNERWQLLFSTLEIFRQNGVDRQIFYVQSIRKELFDLLKKYKEAGAADIEKWNLIDLGSESENEIDPNTQLAWRNQGAAHTDCFLKYREAAEFIIVADIDDILFPQLKNNYFDEFLYLKSQYPLAAGFTYNRTHLKVSPNKTPTDFSLPHLLNSLEQTGEGGSGKSVVIPSRVQTVWLHWPIIIEKNYEMIDIPNKDNMMLHFSKWNMINSTAETKKMTAEAYEDPDVTKIIESINTKNLKINADKFIAENAFEVYQSLPTNIIYFPLIQKCYYDIFYSKPKKKSWFSFNSENVQFYAPESCPGPIKCEIPPFPGISCVIARRRYSHNLISKGLKIHYPTRADVFLESLSGCSM